MALKSICEKYNIKFENVCYIGDDINDVETLKLVGLGCVPADAQPRAKEVAKYVAKAKGGEGVIREVADMLCR